MKYKMNKETEIVKEIPPIAARARLRVV
jgi:hypothetical protein